MNDININNLLKKKIFKLLVFCILKWGYFDNEKYFNLFKIINYEFYFIVV